MSGTYNFFSFKTKKKLDKLKNPRIFTSLSSYNVLKIQGYEHSTKFYRTEKQLENAALEAFKTQYEELKTSWNGYAGYDNWVKQANNAAFGAQAAYDELVPGFEALFEREGQNWQRFYEAVRQLATMPATERIRALKHLSGDLTRG